MGLVRVLIIVTAFILLAASSARGGACPDRDTRVFIVNSYSMTNVSTARQTAGLLRSLRFQEALRMRLAYMDIDARNFSETKRRAVAAEVIRQVEEFKPDYVITTDDPAFELIGVPLSKAGYRVMSSGILKPFSAYRREHSLDPSLFVVAEARVTLSALYEMLDGARMKVNDWYVLWESSNESFLLMKQYERELEGAPKFVNVASISDLRRFLTSLRKDDVSVLVISLNTLYSHDGRCYVSHTEVMREVRFYNRRHVEVTAVPALGGFGALLNIGPCRFSMGVAVGRALIDARKGEFAHQVIVVDPTVSMNIKRARVLGLEDLLYSNLSLIDNYYEGY
jgi:hypothetical protein